MIKDAIIKEPISFDTPVAQDLSLEDYIADSVESLPNQRIERIDFKKDVFSSLNLLNERERFIILNRFGLKGRKAKTLEELGNILGPEYFPYFARRQPITSRKVTKQPVFSQFITSVKSEYRYSGRSHAG